MGYVNPPTARLENISQNENPNPVNENPFCDEESEVPCFGHVTTRPKRVWDQKRPKRVFNFQNVL